MLLTQLVENLVTHLNSSPESWVGDSGIEAKAELDPMLCMLPELGVYIVPGLVQYDMDASEARLRRLNIHSILFVSLIISKRFVDLPYSEGVANWDEVKPIVDIRQRAEEYIISYEDTTLQLTDVEPEPFDELELDNRNFVGVTNFGYRQQTCVSQHALPSSLAVFRDGIESQGTTASARRQLLSERRLGRR